MNPRIVVDARTLHVLGGRTAAPRTAAARRYSWALCGAGIGAGALATILGARLPPLLPVALLVVLVAIAGNRVALYPNEWAATAETAVLLAAVVGLANDGGYLGPWVVALATGPLDVVHWRVRSFSRMAYNSGTRMLAVLVAAGGFHVVGDAGGASHALQFALAAMAASLLYAAVEVLAYVGYECVRSHRAAWAAARDGVLCDPLIVPLGLLGSLAGWLAVVVGWWAAVLVLAPTFYVPEIVLVRARRALPTLGTSSVARRVGLVAVSLCVLGPVVALAPLPGTTTLAALAACALVLALDLGVGRTAVPPAVGVMVAGAIVVAPDAALVVAVTVAVVATTTAWWRADVPATWWAPLPAALAAGVGAAVFGVATSGVGALAAALAFQLLVTVRRDPLVWTAPVAWRVPVVCTGVALAELGHAIGDGAGGVAWGVALVGVAACASVWGRPPWDSRLLARWGAGRHWNRRAMLVLSISVSASCAVAAIAVDGDGAGWIAAASGAAAAATAMVVVGVRQWRFVPRRRRWSAATLGAAAVVTVVGYPPCAGTGSGWSLAVLAAALVVAGAVGWPLARRVDRLLAE